MTFNARPWIVASLAVAATLVAGPRPGAAIAPDPGALVQISRRPVPVSLVAREQDRLVLVSRGRLLADAAPRRGLAGGGFSLQGPVVDLAVVGSRCFISDDQGTVRELDLEGLPRGGRSSSLVLPGARRPVHLASMDDHLVVAEDGVGLRVLRVNAPHHGQGHRETSVAGPDLWGAVALPSDFVAVTATDRRIFAATSAGAIAVVDAESPAEPQVARWLDADAGITALAASGDLLYVLGRNGLSVLDLAEEPPALVLHAAQVQGTSITLAGRRLDVASETTGLTTYLNRDAAAQTINVSVNNNFFSPEDIVILPGDSVRWRNLSGFHNVVSCVPEQMGCDGVLADEPFTNGPVLGPPWLFIHTFDSPGYSPYICIPHAPFMRGTVTVETPPPPPLPVQVDVKPGSCDNPVNTRSRGVLPVAILGGPQVEVAAIDVGTLRLAGVPPLRASMEDVAGPPEPGDGAGPCGAGCPSGPDGLLDLSLKFDQAQVLAALGPASDRQCVMLDLTGRLRDPAGERDLVGGDPVVILARPPGRP